MKYTIRANAMNSLDIAIRHFKLFFFNKTISSDEMYDHIKISLLFLENSIELFLKSILIVDDAESIYCYPDSTIIQQAREWVETSENGDRLEDFLLQHSEDFKTIGYGSALKKYYRRYPLSQRAKDILIKLGGFRNSITHFGIDFTNRFDDVLCCFTETFDVIYNHLYPQLISLEDVGDYFTEDDIFVMTPHGVKPLFDEDYVYNNIVDFLDELEEITQDYVREICCANPKRKIKEFIVLLNSTVPSDEFQSFLCEKHLRIELDEEDSSFKIINSDEQEGEFYVITHYSTYHNATIFRDESGYILFCIEHTENKLYIYNDSQYYPCWDEAENYYQWRSDVNLNYCKCVELNQDNLLVALKQTIISNISSI